jgi:hypothetical protein
MSAWRVIITDTESLTGVAPVCPEQDDPEGRHRILDEHADMQSLDGVFDCCPHPHIETWSETAAVTVAIELTHADADLCS